MLTLRHLSAVAMNAREGEFGGFATVFFEKSTQEEMDRALAGFNAWWEGVVEKKFCVDEQNAAYDAVWTLIHAYIQFAHEDGVRTGLRLMGETIKADGLYE